jgi:hypothetical protein
VSWYCSHPGCERRGVWKDEDTGLSYCDGHTGVIDEAEDRRDFAEEYARAAAREAARGDS